MILVVIVEDYFGTRNLWNTKITMDSTLMMSKSIEFNAEDLDGNIDSCIDSSISSRSNNDNNKNNKIASNFENIQIKGNILDNNLSISSSISTMIETEEREKEDERLILSKNNKENVVEKKFHNPNQSSILLERNLERNNFTTITTTTTTITITAPATASATKIPAMKQSQCFKRSVHNPIEQRDETKEPRSKRDSFDMKQKNLKRKTFKQNAFHTMMRLKQKNLFDEKSFSLRKVSKKTTDSNRDAIDSVGGVDEGETFRSKTKRNSPSLRLRSCEKISQNLYENEKSYAKRKLMAIKFKKMVKKFGLKSRGKIRSRTEMNRSSSLSLTSKSRLSTISAMKTLETSNAINRNPRRDEKLGSQLKSFKLMKSIKFLMKSNRKEKSNRSKRSSLVHQRIKPASSSNRLATTNTKKSSEKNKSDKFPQSYRMIMKTTKSLKMIQSKKIGTKFSDNQSIRRELPKPSINSEQLRLVGAKIIPKRLIFLSSKNQTSRIIDPTVMFGSEKRDPTMAPLKGGTESRWSSSKILPIFKSVQTKSIRLAMKSPPVQRIDQKVFDTQNDRFVDERNIDYGQCNQNFIFNNKNFPKNDKMDDGDGDIDEDDSLDVEILLREHQEEDYFGGRSLRPYSQQQNQIDSDFMHEIKSKSFGQNQSQQQEQNCRTESMQSKMDRSNEEVVGKKVFNQKSSTETLTNDEMEDLNDALTDLNTSINTLKNSYANIIQSLVSMQNRRKDNKKINIMTAEMIEKIDDNRQQRKADVKKFSTSLPSSSLTSDALDDIREKILIENQRNDRKRLITIDEIVNRSKTINYIEKYSMEKFLDPKYRSEIFATLFDEIDQINEAFEEFRKFFDNEGYFQPNLYNNQDRIRITRQQFQDCFKMFRDINRSISEVLKDYNNELLDMFRLKSSIIS
ncbi:hypothetical protein SSS_06386 [Sarcoptes scabiei]|uniref:Uncharacterized protein n=2 Tax=Sarcoptes scabiei TaxID=52283 RepID=A0A834R7C2_SARSC|nr:hypothetical protein SSS_06386 [Sarcoptes scabiei]